MALHCSRRPGVKLDTRGLLQEFCVPYTDNPSMFTKILNNAVIKYCRNENIEKNNTILEFKRILRSFHELLENA